jgi:hypothetical protein
MALPSAFYEYSLHMTSPQRGRCGLPATLIATDPAIYFGVGEGGADDSRADLF